MNHRQKPSYWHGSKRLLFPDAKTRVSNRYLPQDFALLVVVVLGCAGSAFEFHSFYEPDAREFGWLCLLFFPITLGLPIAGLTAAICMTVPLLRWPAMFVSLGLMYAVCCLFLGWVFGIAAAAYLALVALKFALWWTT